MHLPKEKILFNSPFSKELEILLDCAEKAINTRQPIWSTFVSAQIIEEVQNKFSNLNDIRLYFEGGFPSSERKRICFEPTEKATNFPIEEFPIKNILTAI